jgi:hypothetical protein
MILAPASPISPNNKTGKAPADNPPKRLRI